MHKTEWDQMSDRIYRPARGSEEIEIRLKSVNKNMHCENEERKCFAIDKK